LSAYAATTVLTTRPAGNQVRESRPPRICDGGGLVVPQQPIDCVVLAGEIVVETIGSAECDLPHVPSNHEDAVRAENLLVRTPGPKDDTAQH
jgi:hypothetical protein